MSPRRSVYALLLANLVPLGGIVLFDWRVFDVAMLYWVENVVIGVINLLRMGISRAPSPWIPALFFAVHYGLFCYGHLVALVELLGDSAGIETASQYFLAVPLSDAWRSPLWVGVAAIAASHLYSFFSNFVGTGEYRRASVMLLMFRPYGRIVLLHAAILVGALLVQMLGSPVMMLVALIAVKVAMDLRLHTSERRKFGALA